ncbi:MAG: ATP-dependent helicase [Chloroflexia bacterium]|nr:ATP-dependent helicase [Chloroflexia bacterium]
MFQPREAQSRVLDYQGGFLAVSAVPGSGKTVTLAALAARLLPELPDDGAVLVVTYMNSAVDNLRHRIDMQRRAGGVQQGRYEVRTLHSLARDILLQQPGLAGVVSGFPVLDERLSGELRDRATELWLQRHPDFWADLLGEEDGASQRRFWQQRLLEIAGAAIKLAKNRRWRPRDLLARLEEAGRFHLDLPRLAAEIYALYQSFVENSGGLDFDDLVWRAVDLLEYDPDLLERLRRRWPYILEDEAQDSVPLQEELLGRLAGPQGNWVRVGDPNQAITSTFTAAHPRFFRAFMQREDVQTITMEETGRCAPPIMVLANHLVEWTCRQHPLPEVRRRAFRLQYLRPVPPGDAQANPPTEESRVAIRARGYEHRERQELPRLVELLESYRRRFPQRTLAVLVPTNEVGYRLVELLRERDIPHDELLESSAQARGLAGTLAALLAFAAEPLSREALEASFRALVEQEWLVLPPGQGQRERLALLLRSRLAPEVLLYPQEGQEPLQALPAGRARPQDLEILDPMFALLRRTLQAAPLPIDQFVLVLAAELFGRPADLATVQQVAAYLRLLAQQEPTLRLPDLAGELQRIAQGRRRFIGLSEDDLGFEPQAGRVTVATQHRAKGLEWDLVCLAGIDRYWVPHDLEQAFQGSYEQVGGNPTAIVQAQLRALMGDAAASADPVEATREANLETIAERLRLLYVGLTRARRHLYVSWSRVVEVYGRDREQEPTPVLLELARFNRTAPADPAPPAASAPAEG